MAIQPYGEQDFVEGDLLYRFVVTDMFVFPMDTETIEDAVVMSISSEQVHLLAVAQVALGMLTAKWLPTHDNPSIEKVHEHGIPFTEEFTVRKIFPRLNDYEFISEAT